MIRLVLLTWLFVLTPLTLAEDQREGWPRPEYQRHSEDPEWLVQVVHFHGHLGPSVVAGARMGMAGLRAVKAKGYFDVEVICEGPLARPPQACFLDGVQVSTGATLGKRTLQWVSADRIVLRLKNTRTGQTAEVRPTPLLLDLFGSIPSQKKTSEEATDKVGHDHMEAVARKIASLAEKGIVIVTTAAARK